VLTLADFFSSAAAKPAGADAKKKRRTGKAYSYVSFVHGEIMTHQTWAECEARVKGARAAKFKKAMSAEDEKNIIHEFTH
jgi:ribonuclease HI